MLVRDGLVVAALTASAGFTEVISRKMVHMYCVLCSTWKYNNITTSVAAPHCPSLVLKRSFHLPQKTGITGRTKKPFHRNSAHLGEQGRCMVLGQRWSVSVSLPVSVLCWADCPGMQKAACFLLALSDLAPQHCFLAASVISWVSDAKWHLIFFF